MKKNYTHISILIDKSGSMRRILQDTIGGLNEFIRKQREIEGKCTVSLVQFENSYDKFADFVDITAFPALNEQNYVPRGGTALIDSMCRFIDETGLSLSKLEETERPEKVIFLAITDGEENSSREFTKEQLKERTILQEGTFNWQFVYIGANQDAFGVAQSYGLSKSRSLNFNATTKGSSVMYSTLSDTSVLYRTGTTSTMDFSPEEQKLVSTTK